MAFIWGLKCTILNEEKEGVWGIKAEWLRSNYRCHWYWNMTAVKRWNTWALFTRSLIKTGASIRKMFHFGSLKYGTDRKKKLWIELLKRKLQSTNFSSSSVTCLLLDLFTPSWVNVIEQRRKVRVLNALKVPVHLHRKEFPTRDRIGLVAG